MTQVTELAAEARDRAGKGISHAIRREGKTPAVIYGDKKPPIMITLDNKALLRLLERPGFFTHLIDLSVGKETHRVLPRDAQFDPVSDKPLHVDFLRVSATTRIRVDVPVVFVNAEKSPGIKKGGTLNVVHHEIEVLCAPDRIPEKFEISLEGLEINQAVHLSTLKLPEGVSLTTHEKDFTVATIAVPSAIRAEAEEAAAAAAATAAAPAAEGAAAAPAAGSPAAPAAGKDAKAAGGAAAAPAAGKSDAKKADKK